MDVISKLTALVVPGAFREELNVVGSTAKGLRLFSGECIGEGLGVVIRDATVLYQMAFEEFSNHF